MKNLIFFLAVFGLIFSSCKETTGEKAEVSEAKEVVESTGTTVVMNTDESRITWGATKVTGAGHAGEMLLARGSVTVKDKTLSLIHI